MTSGGPLELVARIAAMLDDLEIPYALGGSLAASFFGEPRSTMDIDVAIDVGGAAGEALIEQAAAAFVVPATSARDALRTHGSLNLLSAEGGMKVALFVLGDDILDRRQIDRRGRRIGVIRSGTTCCPHISHDDRLDGVQEPRGLIRWLRSRPVRCTRAPAR